MSSLAHMHKAHELASTGALTENCHYGPGTNLPLTLDLILDTYTVLIDDQAYTGWNPFNDPYFSPPPSRVIRKVQSDGFVSKNDPDLPCHHDGESGSTAVAEVNAGSTVVFQWSYRPCWRADHQGPVSTYMTSCNGDCSSFMVTGARWFKIDAGGYDQSTRQWAADKLRADNNSWTSIVPAGLMPGQYLMRNEIVALHSGASNSQHYPACLQLNVRGSGKGYPSEGDYVSIPGLYDNVAFPNIYGNFGSFPPPGPSPVTLDERNPPFTITATPSSTAGTAATPIGTRRPGGNPLNNDGEGVCRLVSRKRT
ncbi:endoglucanase iv precursor [Moniliophthora roreri]|nr:endoglucanase iv precursor [Moniliophthora roreri]